MPDHHVQRPDHGGFANQPLQGNPNPYVGITWIGAEGFPVMHGLSTAAGASIDQFNSFHPGVFHFARADDSVEGIQEDIDLDTLKDLAGMADGDAPGAN